MTESSQNILQKASFYIKAGTSTAIVGPSGSGKSTIVQLLNRFYDPIEGKILFDKDDLKNKSLVALRETIGYVSQEPVLIIGTIRENLGYGNPKATEADMIEALRKSSANFVFEDAGDIKKLEKGLDTFVGASSLVNLSGGQK
jgi:ABC-type multidrug transport system fused ATPase/permease subunit